MTADEIKQRYSMEDVLLRYGIQSKGIRKNISCPFHKDAQPSMKIFKDGFKCFSCNESGDIFKFVQLMERCSFKDAFMSLGGEYEKIENDFFATQRLERAKNDALRRKSAEIRHKKLKLELSSLIEFYRAVLDELEPFSDDWCFSYNALFYLLYAWEEKYLNGSEVDISGVIGRYSVAKFVRNNIGQAV